MIKLKKIILTVIIFGHFPLFSNDEIDFLIKSRQWKRIGQIFSQREPRLEKEYFALARFHEESGFGDSDVKFRLLASIALGKKVQFVTETELQQILKNPFPHQSALIRLTFWKLYKEFSARKMLSTKNKIIFLEKFAKEDDPICIEVFEEILKILYQSQNFTDVIKKLESLSESEKSIFFTPQIRQKYAQSLFRVSQKTEAINAWLLILTDIKCPEYVRENIFHDLKFFLKDEMSEIGTEGISLILDKFSKKEGKELYSKKLVDLEKKYENFISIRNITRFLIRHDPAKIPRFFQNHSELILKDPNFIGSVAEELYAMKELDLSERVLNFSSKPLSLSSQRALTRIYFKQKKEKKFFQSLLNYLKENPYDLTFQDKLIDFLTQSNSKGVNFASKEYWENAFQTLPNLPVKGRLVYWYLRFLKEKKDKTLYSILETYYEYCPGSYYIQTIKEEFQNEIAKIQIPKNPNNRKELFVFLSVAPEKQELQELKRKDLSFAYTPESNDLSVRISSVQNKIHSHKLLNLSLDYLQLGEERLGLYLASKYFDSNNLLDEDRLLLLVGLGDLSKNYYLSIFNTRKLMKRYQIADDPLLLPSQIVSRLYPRPHRDLVLKNSEKFNVSEDIIYAVMRQESFFREIAVSSSNAKGLMQIIPSTGKFLAKSFREKEYSLFDPSTSIKFGTKFLSDLLKTNHNDIRWATIAYNGGPGNLRKWKRNHFRNDFNHFLEEIPSKESRDYCRIVVSNYYNYKQLRELFDR